VKQACRHEGPRRCWPWARRPKERRRRELVAANLGLAAGIWGGAEAGRGGLRNGVGVVLGTGHAGGACHGSKEHAGARAGGRMPH
jgi:hypothetical protein